MKKTFFLIILFFLTGCTAYNELNELAIIKSIGIEKNNDKYILYSLVIDEIDKDNIPKTEVIETEGKDIKELFQNIKKLVNKEIYLSHIDLIILNKNIKDNDLNNIINYFINHNEFRNDFLTVISDNIKDVLKNSKYDEIENIIITNKDSKEIIKISFEEIIEKFLNKEIIYVSSIDYQEKIIFNVNYKYINNKLERINNEENRT